MTEGLSLRCCLCWRRSFAVVVVVVLAIVLLMPDLLALLILRMLDAAGFLLRHLAVSRPCSPCSGRGASGLLQLCLPFCVSAPDWVPCWMRGIPGWPGADRSMRGVEGVWAAASIGGHQGNGGDEVRFSFVGLLYQWIGMGCVFSAIAD